MVLGCDRDCDQTVTVITAALVIERLECAGRTLLSLPPSGYQPTGSVTIGWDVVRSYWEGYQSTSAPPIRPTAPSARDISEMDESYGWVPWIKSTGGRRIVQARSLIHPITDEFLFSWRRIADGMQVHHTQVQRLHAQAIETIVARLQRQGIGERLLTSVPE